MDYGWIAYFNARVPGRMRVFDVRFERVGGAGSFMALDVKGSRLEPARSRRRRQQEEEEGEEPSASQEESTGR